MASGSLPPVAGHLFLTRGDITALAYDALLVPSGIGPDGRSGHVGRTSWLERLPTLRDHSNKGYVTPSPSVDRRAVFVAEVHGGPAIWLGHTGEDGRHPTWYAEAASEFVTGAAETA